MSTEPPSSPDHTLAKGESESEIDARMGGPPTRIKADGTRIYQQPMLDGRIRITIIHPDGSEETLKGVPPDMVKKMRESPLGSIPLVHWAQPSKSAPAPMEQTPACPDVQPSTPEASVNEYRKKITAVGWLVICTFSILNESHDHYWGTPSLSWIVLLCATWALLVWLAPDRVVCWPNRNWKKIGTQTKKVLSIVAPLVVLGAIIAVFSWLLIEGNRRNDQKQKLPSSSDWELRQMLKDVVLPKPTPFDPTTSPNAGNR